MLATCMQVSPSVSQKPPVLPQGINALWAWLWATLSVSDSALLNSAGLDAWVHLNSTNHPFTHLNLDRICFTPAG